MRKLQFPKKIKTPNYRLSRSPFEHGEVFVLDDGGEADLDLGNYERFLDVTLNKDNSKSSPATLDKKLIVGLVRHYNRQNIQEGN